MKPILIVIQVKNIISVSFFTVIPTTVPNQILIKLCILRLTSLRFLLTGFFSSCFILIYRISKKYYLKVIKSNYQPPILLYNLFFFTSIYTRWHKQKRLITWIIFNHLLFIENISIIFPLTYSLCKILISFP